jgi:hypothetical protein
VKLTSITLRKAAEIQEKIEKLQADLDTLLENGTEPATAPEPVAQSALNTGRKRGRKPTLVAPTPQMNGSRGRRSASPTGPLASAVVKVLKSKGSPMTVAEILDSLLSSGYKFTSPEPKKNLFARIYRLKGVKQVGPGRFGAE